MLNALLPRSIDNAYRGRKPALWLLALVVFAKVGISLQSIFNGYRAAASGDGIPLDTLGAAGAQAVVTLFALWGVAHLALCLLCILALVRYRAMVPLMFALLLLEQLGRKLVLQFLPIVQTETPLGYAINLTLLALMLVGLALSLWRREVPSVPEEAR